MCDLCFNISHLRGGIASAPLYIHVVVSFVAILCQTLSLILATMIAKVHLYCWGSNWKQHWQWPTWPTGGSWENWPTQILAQCKRLCTMCTYIAGLYMRSWTCGLLLQRVCTDLGLHNRGELAAVIEGNELVSSMSGSYHSSKEEANKGGHQYCRAEVTQLLWKVITISTAHMCVNICACKIWKKNGWLEVFRNCIAWSVLQLLWGCAWLTAFC